MNDNYIFSGKVNWDNTTSSITIIISVLLAWAEYELITAYCKQPNDALLALYVVLLFIIVLVCILTLPRSIHLTQKELIIKKIHGKKRIPLNTISHVSTYQTDKSEIRIVGTGGFFGMRGKYKNATIGTYYSYVCHSQEAIFLKTATKNYVFSCFNNQRLIELIKKMNKIHE